ncbi:MAG: phosphotransferase family protein [Chloroflexota bacterium]
MSISIDDLRTHLTTFIAGKVDSPVRITALQPIPGGASRETWALDIEVESGALVGPHALILRMDQATSMNPEALERSEEFALLRVAYEAGVKAPRPRWLDGTGAVLGRPFLLMDRVEGESIGPRVVRRPEFAQAREHLPQQMAEQLARIHTIDPMTSELGFLPHPAKGYSPARHAIDGVREQLDQIGIQRPALEFGLRWLEQHVPQHEEHILIHGDFRIGNIIIGSDELCAVIDWEFAHIGDPHEDLAWPCVRDWRFGNDALRVGGVGDLETYVVAYEALSGRMVDRTALHYWEVLGNVRWAATCYIQADRHLSGADPSIELASLGRRGAEMELEFLTLIGG